MTRALMSGRELATHAERAGATVHRSFRTFQRARQDSEARLDIPSLS